MFEMQKVGRRLLELRKAYNLTQTELADRIGVSFQAVSNWERGNSMPDISKLPEIAEIFHVSVDELLGEKAMLIEAVLSDTVENCFEEQEISAEEIRNTMPILKPEQLEKIAEKVDKTKLVTIPELLEYMAAGDVYEVAVEAIKAGKEVGMEFIEHMSAADVGKIAIMEYENGKPIQKYLEYMDSESLKRIMWKVMEKG